MAQTVLSEYVGGYLVESGDFHFKFWYDKEEIGVVSSSFLIRTDCDNKPAISISQETNKSKNNRTFFHSLNISVPLPPATWECYK